MVSSCHQTKRKTPAPPRSELRLKNLECSGRLQFFYHCSSSSLPIRDVLVKEKTEPHIEKRAENYVCKCYYWNNILPFLKSTDRYLFLFTTCRSSRRKFPGMSRYRGKRFIVGYIKKEKAPWRHDHYAVQGKTKLVAFENAFPLEKLETNWAHIRVRRLNTDETRRVLHKLEEGKNILPKCLNELESLKTGGGSGERCG